MERSTLANPVYVFFLPSFHRDCSTMLLCVSPFLAFAQANVTALGGGSAVRVRQAATAVMLMETPTGEMNQRR
jgi:hypothetical protein